jgi:hypothetical protein
MVRPNASFSFDTLSFPLPRHLCGRAELFAGAGAGHLPESR